jgi:hypothetical protein
MRSLSLLRAVFAVSVALAGSYASANPLLILPYASQIITYHYDSSGRLIAVVHSGTGAPNGCANSAAVWGSGAMGCFRWGS